MTKSKNNKCRYDDFKPTNQPTNHVYTSFVDHFESFLYYIWIK